MSNMDPWDWYIYLHFQFMVNVGKYTIHGSHGCVCVCLKCPIDQEIYGLMFIFTVTIFQQEDLNTKG